MKVVYGHTDSIYVQIDSVAKAQMICADIQDSVRKHFPNIMGLNEHPVVLEFEKYYSSLGVGTTKNRNAGMITWKDGEWLDEPEFTMTGFTAKRVSETGFAKDTQLDVLKRWVNAESREQINKALHDRYDSALSGNIDLRDIVKRSRLRANRFNVKCPECGTKYHLKDCIKLEYSVCNKCSTPTTRFQTLEGKKPSIGSGIAGVLFAWEKENKDFDDSYLSMKVTGVRDTFTHPLTQENRQVEYVAGVELKDFESYNPDYKHYAEQIVDKAKPIYKAMGWDLSAIRTGKTQKTLEEWF